MTAPTMSLSFQTQVIEAFIESSSASGPEEWRNVGYYGSMNIEDPGAVLRGKFGKGLERDFDNQMANR
jgi:hypothetical protein